jgi:hypothetical protein
VSDAFLFVPTEANAPMVAAPSPGRIVMVRLPFSDMIKLGSQGQARPAIVTAVVGARQINVQVFLDGPNDVIAPHINGDTMWLGTVDYAPAEFNAARTWHWPPRVGG